MKLSHARSVFSIVIVVLHIAFVFGAALSLAPFVTSPETYYSSLSAFLPVFGVYLGVVVEALRDGRRAESVELVEPTYIFVMSALLAAYTLGNIFVVYGFITGFIVSEESLPGAIGIVEAAFGGCFSTLFFRLLGRTAPNAG